MPLWTSSELAEAVGGKANTDFDVDGVAFDSREIGQGDLFFALKGEQSDGHLYLEGVYKAGGAGAVVNEPADGPHVLVSDTTNALNQLAIASRNRTNAKIIGVTGSVGKTGTKEALYAALDRCCFGKAHRSVKSYNNHVGVPLSLSRMPANSEYGIFEMGMNHAGELSGLTQLVRPHVAIITAIAPAHIGNFENIEGIADAKAEIFEGLVDGGTAVIPYDSPYYEQLRAKAAQYTDNIISFGFDKVADVHAVEVVPAAGGGSLVTAKIHGHSLCFTIAEAGKHWVSNALAIMAAVKAVGGDLAAAGLALAELGGIAGRGKRQEINLNSGGKAIVIDESYNANPISMKATLAQYATEECRGKKITILGAMGELGEKAQIFHEALADDIIAADVNTVILVGEEMAHTAAKLNDHLDCDAQISHVASASEALTEVAQIISDEDILLIKGSNYLGLAQVVNALASGEY
ncbi:MAG: UDP-N-acetylmuramoylalanyl-D-glutamyl-2,6-diaminopimelate--D-alanyl-D-alanine ligase [Parasphingorhabdus sp.]